MRSKAGDPPRTMGQRILAAHCDDWEDRGHDAFDLIEVRVDQVVLARDANRILGKAIDSGLETSAVEVSVAYPSQCVEVSAASDVERAPWRISHEALALGFLLAQPGAGFAPLVHLERFSCPSRLLLSDEPRLSMCGGVGMLTLPASRGQLAEALRTGKTSIRPAQSIQILLSGRVRPFVSIRDVTLDMMARGLSEVVARVDRACRAPVILEFSGPSCKYLTVPERAVLAALAPHVGAAGALFASDDKTETYLRDQRRSKAFRALAPDAGAPYKEVFPVDLAAVEPLIMQENGEIHPVREREGDPVLQVLLGGDSGMTLRDFYAVAALLKSKRVTPGLDFLLCPGSRQTLETLSRGALVDLIANGARLVEPDQRVLTGELYAPPPGGLSLKTSDHSSQRRGAIVSAETLAFAVATGHLGDPRGFKRPVRVVVPRDLPTDDVLLIRGGEMRGGAKGKGRVDHRAEGLSDGPPSSGSFTVPVARPEWTAPTELHVIVERIDPGLPCAFVAESLEDIRWLIERAQHKPQIRAVIAAHIPAASVSVLSGLGVLALRADEQALSRLSGAKKLSVPEQARWNGDKLSLGVGDLSILVDWLAVGAERGWTSGE